LGSGVGGLGIGPNPQSPIPKSPIPNPQSPFYLIIIRKAIIKLNVNSL